MEKENFYGKALGLLLGLIACALLTLLWGCGTGRPVVMERVTHDTLKTERVDTVWRDRLVENIVRDVSATVSARRDSVATTVDTEGKVVRTDTWHWLESSTLKSTERTLRDSLEEMRGRYEALLRVKADSVATVAATANPRRASAGLATPWERWCYKVGEITTVLLVAAIVSLMIWLIKRRRQR